MKYSSGLCATVQLILVDLEYTVHDCATSQNRSWWFQTYVTRTKVSPVLSLANRRSSGSCSWKHIHTFTTVDLSQYGGD